MIEVFIFNILEITEIPYFLRNILQIFLRFAFIVFFLSILLKKIIPIKVKLIRMLYLSSIITLLSFIVIKVYLWLYNYFGTDNMQNLYGNLYQVFLLVVLIYIIMNIFIYSIIFEYITYKLGKNEYNNILKKNEYGYQYIQHLIYSYIFDRKSYTNHDLMQYIEAEGKKVFDDIINFSISTLEEPEYYIYYLERR